MTRTALIAGGGIGGMAAAVALARTGWHVRLFEQAPALGEAGAGLQVSPNAVRALDAMGLGEPLRAHGFAPDAAMMRDGRTGRVLYRAALGAAAEARWGAPYLQLHRADLLDLLHDAARRAGVEIVLGTRVTGYLNRPEGVRLDLAEADGGAALDPVVGEVAIGADGIRSALRQRLNGAEDPDFSGLVAWRALVPADRLPKGLIAPAATVWVGPGRHLVTYYLRGGSLVNLVAVEKQSAWTAEGWRQPGDPDRLRGAFRGWHRSLTTLLDAVDETFVWGLFTRPEQVRWTEGRMALLGDAAHPMQPFMAQGAAQAIEDAAALARLLHPAPGDADAEPEALRRYESRRWPRVARVQAQSRANGRLFHREARLARVLQQGAIAAVSRLAPAIAASRLDWLYGHDPTA